MRVSYVLPVVVMLTGSLGSAQQFVRSGDNLRPEPFPAPAPREVSLVRVASGTVLHVRLEESVDSRRNRPGDVFTASVTSPVVENGVTVIPRGARAYGRVV